MAHHEEAAQEGLGLRINRYLADSGQGSRRNVEILIRDGRVQIDGETTTDLSARVSPDQEVRVDGRIVRPSRSTVVFAMNKPVRVLVSEHDPEGRPLAIDTVRPLFSGRLFSIGRLDYMSSGLILFTNDGDLAQKLMRPAYAIDREYVVETREPIPDSMLDSFRSGILVEGERYRLHHYTRHAARRVSLVLTEGKNREIRRVFAHFRLKVRRMYRNRYGPIRLGTLPEGHVRELNDEEIRRLRGAVGSPSRRRATGAARPKRAPVHRRNDDSRSSSRKTRPGRH